MSNIPKWKVYRDGEYIAAFKYAEDAAILAAVFPGSVVKIGHKKVVWTEGNETFAAGESYDRAADVMHSREDTRNVS